ncbi:MAG: 50S ribosomal protein L24 [Saccharofermentanales bacterium]|jgi:large subunit ribosomal protein L24|nr:50S ribosomal protein L24 [Clostridiaceae bacterium]
MSKVHVKKDDNVYVLTGKDAGKTGKVLRVLPDVGRVIVEGVNMSVKHTKPRGRNQQGGIINQESAIASSNVMLICNKCKRPSKTGSRYENNTKVRYCKACNETIDVIREKKQ